MYPGSRGKELSSRKFISFATLKGRYAFNWSKLWWACVEFADEVKQGDIVGLSGNVGNTHLHFQLEKPGCGDFDSADPLFLESVGFVDMDGIDFDGDRGGLPEKLDYYTSNNADSSDFTGWCDVNGVTMLSGPGEPERKAKVIRNVRHDQELSAYADFRWKPIPGKDSRFVLLLEARTSYEHPSRHWILIDGYIKHTTGLCLSVISAHPIWFLG